MSTSSLIAAEDLSGSAFRRAIGNSSSLTYVKLKQFSETHGID